MSTTSRKNILELETTFPTTFFNQYANTLTKSLYNPPIKLIGLKSSKFLISTFLWD